MKDKKWSLIDFTFASDHRGDLVAIDFEKHLPFDPKRFFTTFGVPSDAVRGEHAHYECEQVLVVLKGEIRISLTNGHESEVFHLKSPSMGLFLPSMIWGVQESLNSSSVLGVFASHPYDEADYIRNYEQYLREIKQ
jgi:UDP-2-acetamido-3-amino-2,3-dideoxy-glucuronate N-acetyltransferase